MFLIYEEKEDEVLQLVRNDFGFVSIFDNEMDANIERIYLQPDYDNILVVRGHYEPKENN
jgi:hypothetical protein